MCMGYGYCCCNNCWTLWKVRRDTGELVWKHNTHFRVDWIEQLTGGDLICSGFHMECKPVVPYRNAKREKQFAVSRVTRDGGTVWSTAFPDLNVNAAEFSRAGLYSGGLTSTQNLTANQIRDLDIDTGEVIAVRDAIHSFPFVNLVNNTWGQDYIWQDQVGGQKFFDIATGAMSSPGLIGYPQATFYGSRASNILHCSVGNPTFGTPQPFLFDMDTSTQFEFSGPVTSGADPWSKGTNWHRDRSWVEAHHQNGTLITIAAEAAPPPPNPPLNEPWSIQYDVSTGVETNRWPRFAEPVFGKSYCSYTDANNGQAVELFAGGFNSVSGPAGGFHHLILWEPDGSIPWTAHIMASRISLSQGTNYTYWAAVRVAHFDLDGEFIYFGSERARSYDVDEG